MTKKFKFKLEGLLKLKTFTESRCRAELGQIVKEIEDVKQHIENMKEEIHQCYLEQDRVIQDATSGHILQFFPYFVEGKKEDIKKQESILFALEKKYQRKLKELSDAMGEAKLISNMKEEKRVEHRKEQDKKSAQDQEELFISRKQFLIKSKK